MDNTSPRKKDWTEDSDSDDDPEEMRRQFGVTKSPVKQETDDEPSKPTTSKDDQPVASLLSRIGGLSTDSPPTSSIPSTSSSLPPQSSQPSQPSSSHSRPKPDTSSALFGRALAGVKSRPTEKTETPVPPAPPSQPSQPSQAPKATQGNAGKELIDTPEAPKKKEEGRMSGQPDLMSGPDDGGWGDGSAATAPPANGNGTTTNGAGPTHDGVVDSKMSDSGTGLISNEFEVEVKLADLQADPNNPLYSVKSFEALPLHPSLLKGIYAAGFKKPSKIQEKALPMLLNNPARNLIGQSQSGTGKTAAFTLDMLSRVDPTIMTPQAICLAPSRELARQIQEVVDKIGQFTEIKTQLAVPGSWSRTTKCDKHILIGTPGTLVDMLSRRGAIFDSKMIRVLVLDEADEMLALQGLGDQTNRIKRALPKSMQLVLFSATFPPEVQTFAESFAPEANSIFLRQEEVTVETIKQLYLECDGEDQKYEALSALYDCMAIGQSIVFCKRRDTADRIANRLTAEGHSVAALHSEKMNRDRDDILDGFRNGKTKVLITTNVVARGIDISQINMVVNYDIPDTGPDGGFQPDIETYIHRIGRTGRFGRKGCSVIFAHDSRSKDDIEQIMTTLGKRMKRIDARSTTDLEQLEKALKLALKGPN